MRTVPLGINFKDFDYLTPFVPAPRAARAEPAVARAEARPVHDRLLRRIAPEKGLDGSPRPTYCCARSGACRRRGSKPPAGWAPIRSRISQGSRRGCAKAGLVDEFRYRGELDRLEKVRFLARSTSSRCRRRTASRRASRSSRRWRRACRSCSRRTARSPRWCARPAAACSSKPDDADSARRRDLAAVPGSRGCARARPARRRRRAPALLDRALGRAHAAGLRGSAQR